MDAFRKQLDMLMGSDRDGAPVTDGPAHFTDPEVCKPYLCGICPYSLFANTKLGGECEKVHDPHLKMEYEAARESGRDFGYETDLLRILERYVTDCDHKIAQCQRRLEEDNAQTIDKSIDQTAEITTKIEETMVKAEKLGEEGKVQESMALMTEVENLRKQKEAIQANAVLAAAPSLAAGGRGVPRGNNQQKLRVCDVCAAYLSITDTDRRLADHFAGRTHLGYRQIRDKYNELKTRWHGIAHLTPGASARPVQSPVSHLPLCPRRSR
ncbi:putative RNA-binding protein Luc7 2 [Paratrimastix pyriformis]|uniref:RNA-binding protein Luc7 2 n=1 Tax=Paratrimastix pyriformis TaxID=342808 RepID=A0ABQ8UTZ1_9EUKA|nr:putative RNA-binding protein Luc7 2 [Paratrimastix pyriformis]